MKAKAAKAKRRAAKKARRPVRKTAAPRAAKTTVKKAAGKKAATRKPAAKQRRKAAARRAPAGVKVLGALRPRDREILTPGALAFLVGLHRRFDGRRLDLLAARTARQRRFDAGELPDFLFETEHIRGDDSWTVVPIPADLQDRRVEITGPVDRKMIVNALNSGATHYMADFEDANSPTWANNLDGQINLKDLWAGDIDFTDPDSGKRYAVGPDPAVLIVRPRGWHLPEAHLTVGGRPIAGALFDFGLYVFHNAQAQLARGTAPYFYLPKLESHQEARLWNDVFLFAQEQLGLLPGTIKATVLIETLPAAFEMEEILWELRPHIAGMNAGRWDYIFSFIKTFAKQSDPRYVLPDRSQVVMGKAFLGAYADLLVRTCHRRKAFAMGGMAAQIPIKGDPAANEAAFAKVRADKEREVGEGFDGTWVAHPDLVPVAKDVFDRLMPQPNQVARVPDVRVGRGELLRIHEGTRTEAGFRLNIRVGVQYIEAWLRGRGAVPIYHLMEDAATAEISRAQIWQWIKAGADLDGGVKATAALFDRALDEEMEVVKREIGPGTYAKGRFPEAIKLFRELSLADEFEPFLTLPAYDLIK
ncbi:MAG TPA: malate synthase A [Pseudolabrys sp.]|nr:malate synthase A [Pseudolabrys sp.]